jgi:hypothetical protein
MLRLEFESLFDFRSLDAVGVDGDDARARNG